MSIQWDGLTIDPVEDRGKDLPSDIQLIISHKVAVITLESIKDQCLVGLWDLGIGESVLVCQVELGRDGSGDQTRGLGVELHVDGFRRLDSNDELVSCDVLEDSGGDILVLNSDLDLGFVESCGGEDRRASERPFAATHCTTYPFRPS